MPVSPARLLDLQKLQCRIFSHTFNPTRARTGNSVLRQRLRGPSVAAYYPRKVTSIKSMLHNLRQAHPDLDLDTWDDDEEERLEHVAFVKARGKGAPKKKKGPDESKKIKKKSNAAPKAPKEISF